MTNITHATVDVRDKTTLVSIERKTALGRIEDVFVKRNGNGLCFQNVHGKWKRTGDAVFTEFYTAAQKYIRDRRDEEILSMSWYRKYENY
jgi:hypothetical protein